MSYERQRPAGHQPTCNAILLSLKDGTPDESACNCGHDGTVYGVLTTRQPDSQPADDDQPRYRARRRRTRPYGEIMQQRFWEMCVHVALQTEGARQAIENADRALEAWRERWDKAPAAPEPAETHRFEPVDGVFGEILHTGNAAAGRKWSEEARGAVFSKAYQPPVFGLSTSPHAFKPVEGNRYCGDCGAGRLHAIHTPEPAPDGK